MCVIEIGPYSRSDECDHKAGEDCQWRQHHGGRALQFVDQMVARDPDCKVFEVQEREFSHRCSLGPGAGGAPILTADGARVIGVEMWGKEGLEWAARADQLLARSSVLRGLQ
jgi:hypothetical protein